MADLDDKFYERADAHINLSNTQLADITPGKVSASTLYAAARFNAWVSAGGFASGAQMTHDSEVQIAYFVKEYTAMLRENYADYAANFDRYMRPDAES